MLLDVFDTVIGGINQLGQTLGLSWIAVIVLALLLVTIVISFCATIFSSEIKTARAVEKLNAYLESNPFINDENLVEFNKLMKKIPAPMRAQWQQYMVNRDKKPSQFFTEDKCIDKPFKASGYKNHITAIRAIVICLAILSFVFSVGAVSSVTNTLAVVLAESLLLPLVVVFVGEIYLLFLKSRRNRAIADLYGIFSIFQHAIDRAVTTLPDYVDYEILFTRKEIVSGIPVLQEYLQQRALFEQEQIRKAKESQVEHEEYDFSSLGINGSLVMERAMRECEYYLGNRKRVLAEISELQGSRDLLEKSYEEKNKTNQRKLRDIQESLDRLKEKLDNTTNIIVGNDLRKQRENEIQKQRQLEREIEEDNNKYDADKKALDKQIDEKRAEIETFRKTAESSLNGEFKTYADKIYSDIKAIVDKEFREEIDSIKSNNQELQLAVEERDKAISEKTVIYDEKLRIIEEYANRIAEQEQLINELQSSSNENEQEISNRDSEIQSKDKEIFDINRTLESRKLEIEKKNKEIDSLKETIKELKRKKQVEVYRYFDANGVEFYVDEQGNAYYQDEQGNAVYAESAIDNNVEDVVEEEVIDEVNETSENQQAENTEVENVEVPEKQEEVLDDKTEEVEVDKETEEDLTEELSEISNSEIEKMLEELDAEMAEENEDESKKAKQAPELRRKPLYDFTWENSNSPEQFEPEPVEERKEEPVPEEKLEQTEIVAEAETENKKPAQEIEDIEKEIENQNAELDKQAKNLSAQLEETKAIAKADVKEKPKKAVKKPAKKSAKKQTVKKSTKSTSKKEATKKVAEKKAEPKKETVKAEVKKEAPKKASAKKPSNKVSNSKAKKPEVKKSTKVSKPASKKKNSGGNDDVTVGDLSLMEFNEQLKSVLKEINESDSK